MTRATICKVEGCGKPANVAGKSARDLCCAHYQRDKKFGSPLGGGRMRVRGGTTCDIDGCEKKAVGNGYCPAHNVRFRKYGSATAHHPIYRCNEIWIEKHRDYHGDDCLPWPFCTGDNGRGVMGRGAKSMTAPRAMCIAAHGQPPTPEHETAHSCGNGHLGCMNPKHLRWATKIENAADRDKHGRTRRGSQINTSKLSEDDVRAIRRRRGTESGASLAREYGISRNAVYYIISGKTWANLK